MPKFQQLQLIPTQALLDEYGLNEVAYRTLCLVRDAKSLFWQQPAHQQALKKISGNPAVSLHKLIDRRLLIGPPRDERIGSRPIFISDEGLNLLLRIGRGLHKVEWISPARAKVLRFMANTGGALHRGAHDTRHGFSLTTLRSLEKNGYIESGGVDRWHLTALGKEAWIEYRQAQATD